MSGPHRGGHRPPALAWGRPSGPPPPPAIGHRCACTTGAVRHKAEAEDWGRVLSVTNAVEPGTWRRGLDGGGGGWHGPQNILWPRNRRPQPLIPPAMGHRCACTTGAVRHKAEAQSKSQRETLFSDMAQGPFAAVERQIQGVRSGSTAPQSYELCSGGVTYHRTPPLPNWPVIRGHGHAGGPWAQGIPQRGRGGGAGRESLEEGGEGVPPQHSGLDSTPTAFPTVSNRRPRPLSHPPSPVTARQPL